VNKATMQKLAKPCPKHDPWPPATIAGDPPQVQVPALGSPPQTSTDYGLRGPQVEPEAAFWTVCEVPCVVRIADLVQLTDDSTRPEWFFEDYPTNQAVLSEEIDELIELASLRDDPEAVFSRRPGRERRAISPFLQLRPQPIGAVINLDRDPVLRPIRHGRQPYPGALPIARGEEVDPAFPVVHTGRELARYFESETPGLAHRLALNDLIRVANFSPPRQALVWAALDIAIYSALLAAWHYKWAADVPGGGRPPRLGVSRRPRPVEVDYRVGVLFNRAVTPNGSAGDDGRRLLPSPSPGTPRHPAYPSGHSTYAGAASEMLTYFFPDYKEEFDRLADNAGMARLWAGIHWRSDHIQGVKLGRNVARMIIEQMGKSCVCPPDDCSPPDPCALPPDFDELSHAADAVAACCDDGHDHDHHHGDGHDHGDHDNDHHDNDHDAATGPAPSTADVRGQAQGPQEGADLAGSESSQREQATGPQEGAAAAGSSEQAAEQAQGPQEGAR